jgi:hypothetical protein
MLEFSNDSYAYCSSPENGTWHWSDQHSTACWRFGTVIGFRPELEQILRRRLPDGLPPLPAVLVVLAACRDSWQELKGHEPNYASLFVMLGLEDPDRRARLIEGLNCVAALPYSVRGTIEAKAALVEFLFEEGSIRTSPEQAQEICRLLGQDTPLPPTEPLDPLDLPTAANELIDALQRLDAQTLQLRQTTGLDELVRPAELTSQPSASTRKLIAQLQDDHELGGVARVARSLLAAVNLPRPLTVAQDLPEGGFSDLTNRGSLDRLLVSELAQDDLTLAVRVAMNEALYMRRESPPSGPAPRRGILVDAGIRLWGVPRVFATAVAMALCAATEPHVLVAAYRAKGADIQRVNLGTREGLVAHLATLTTDTHPGRALGKFLKEVRQDLGGKDTQHVLVTTPDVLADREFQYQLAEVESAALLITTVARDGTFQLLEQLPHSRKLLGEAKLDLNELLVEGRGHRTSILKSDASDDLPRSVLTIPFPLRIPVTRFHFSNSWEVPQLGVLEVTRDRDLLLWDESTRAPQQIAAPLPGKLTVVAASTGSVSDGNVEAILWHDRNTKPHLLKCHVPSRSAELIPLGTSNKHSYSFYLNREVVFAFGWRECEVLSFTSGSLIETLPLKTAGPLGEALQWKWGRILRSENGCWYAMTYNGVRAGLELIVDAPELIGVFDSIAHGGPIGMTSEGNVWFLPDRQPRKAAGIPPGEYEIKGVSECGRWVSLKGKSERRRILTTTYPCDGWIDIQLLKFHEESRGCRQETCLQRVNSSEGFKKVKLARTRGIYATEEQLVLVNSRSERKLFYDAPLRRIQLSAPCSIHPTDRMYRSFGPPWKVFKASHPLRLARWDDGSAAMIDRRGILHLKSSAPDLPEVSIVLAEEEVMEYDQRDFEVAGWCSDGRRWGNPTFLLEEPNTDPHAIYHEVLLPWIQRLRWRN